MTVELFIAKNEAGETPLHVAAKHGHLDQVPAEFLTKETLTILATPPYAPQGVYSTASGYLARTQTPLHVAASYGHADQIPEDFLTPEFLSLESKGYRQTVLHLLASTGNLGLVPSIYANSEMWDLPDHLGRTPRDYVEEKLRHEKYIACKRAEPATEKQKQKLRWFGCTWEDEITKGQASEAIDECVKRFPQLDAAYYARPATDEQLARLPKRFRYKHLTYGTAKDLISELESNR